MTKTLAWLLSLFAAAALLTIAGCSDDKKDTTITYKDGDENSEEFQALQNGEEGSLELTGNMLAGTFMIGGLILGDSANPNAAKGEIFPAFASTIDTSDSLPILSFTKTYRAGSSDWLVNLTVQEVEEDGDTASLIYIDSMKFFSGNTAVQWPDSASLTRVENGMSLEVQEGLPPGAAKAKHGGIFAGHKWTIAGDSGEIASSGDIAIQGTGYCDIEFAFTIGDSTPMAQSATILNCNGLFDFAQNINGLALNLADVENDGCPASGSIHLGGEVDVACLADTGVGGFDLQGDHTVDIVFNGDSTNVIIRSGDTEWKITEPCSVDTHPTSAKSWRRVADLLMASKRR